MQPLQVGQMPNCVWCGRLLQAHQRQEIDRILEVELRQLTGDRPSVGDYVRRLPWERSIVAQLNSTESPKTIGKTMAQPNEIVNVYVVMDPL